MCWQRGTPSHSCHTGGLTRSTRHGADQWWVGYGRSRHTADLALKNCPWRRGLLAPLGGARPHVQLKLIHTSRHDLQVLPELPLQIKKEVLDDIHTLR